VKYSTLQYRAVFSFMRDATTRGAVINGNFCVPMVALTELCKVYLEPVGLRMKESKRNKANTVSIERNDYDKD
jgi:hypothetical protein